MVFNKSFFVLAILLLIISNLFAQTKKQIFQNTWYGFNAGNILVDRYPTSAVLADFDNDGDLDVAASKFPGGSGFVLLLNDREGFFIDTFHYSSPKPSLGITANYFNEDGLIDIAITNTGLNSEGASISVFFNLGSGSFTSPINYPTGFGPVGITSNDFNNDGFVDIAVANYGYLGQGNSISLLINNGLGQFPNQLTFQTGAGPFDLKSANLNNDNFADIAVACDGQKMNVHFNSNGIDFSQRSEYNVFSIWAGDMYPNLEIVDLDNDGDNDILYSSTKTWDGIRGLLAYFKNNSTGSFQQPLQIQLKNYTSGAIKIKSGDLNKDGWKDLVVSNLSNPGVGFQVILNNGSNTFQQAESYIAGYSTWDILIGDIDRDSSEDVITTDNGSLQITVHKGLGNGRFFVPTLYPTSPLSDYLYAADIDLDGDLDLVSSANYRTGVGVPVSLLKNIGYGVFGNYQVHSIRSGGVRAKFRDLNNDGYVDLIFATSLASPPYDVHFAFNNGDGSFGTIQTNSLNSCGWCDIEAVDIDNNNFLDLILTECYGCPGISESGKRIYILKNQGNGSFEQPQILISNYSPNLIVTADFNNDSNSDLVIGHSGLISVLLGNGNGTFQTAIYSNDGKLVDDLIIDDFNIDGKLDIGASTFYSESGLSIWLGNGDGSFQTSRNFEGASVWNYVNVSGITAGDINGDSLKEIFICNPTSNTISYYRNLNNGNFKFEYRVGSYYNAFSPIFYDFNYDGYGDLAFLVSIPPSGLNSAVYILKGDTSRIYTEISSEIVPIESFNLMQNYPNPFNDQTTIEFEVPFPSKISLKVYDILGREIATLFNKEFERGLYSTRLNANDLSTGVYFYELISQHYRSIKKMIIVK